MYVESNKQRRRVHTFICILLWLVASFVSYALFLASHQKDCALSSSRDCEEEGEEDETKLNKKFTYLRYKPTFNDNHCVV